MVTNPRPTTPPTIAADRLTPHQADPPIDPAPAPPKKPTRHTLGEKFADPDLVDAIFDHILAMIPELAGAAIEPTKDAIRREFGGAQQYIRANTVERRKRDIQRAVRRMFDGRNASHIARVLNISRATVYRCLKQPGPPDEA